MRKLIFITVLGVSLLSILLAGCQKELKETSLSTQVQNDKKISQASAPNQLVTAMGVSFGSTTAPGGDLIVPEALSGIIYRIDPETGDKSVFAEGLPLMIPEVGIGGVMDVAFMGSTAYALVTLVDDPSLFPTGQVNGIYRIDGPDSYEIIADIGAFNLAHPPSGFPIDVSTGVLYSFQAYRGGFLVNDGHFNRVLHVTLDGEISILKQFGNVVPTGLDVKGNDIFISLAGPVPHLPQNGKIVSLSKNSGTVETIASGAPLVVDVEFGRGQTLFALSQGDFSGDPEGSPALPNTGSLVRANSDGTFSVVGDELDRPTSLEIIGNTAYVITIEGEVWTIDDIASPPFGRH